MNITNWLTPREAREITGYSLSRLYMLRRQGKIRAQYTEAGWRYAECDIVDPSLRPPSRRLDEIRRWLKRSNHSAYDLIDDLYVSYRNDGYKMTHRTFVEYIQRLRTE